MEIVDRTRNELKSDRGKSEVIERPRKHGGREDKGHNTGSDSEFEFVFRNRGLAPNTDSLTEGCTSKSHGNRKRKRDQLKICLRDVVKKEGETYYRSNFKTAIKELKLLHYDEDQLQEVKRTPFWLLFNAIYRSDSERLRSRCDKNEKIIRKIIMCFNASLDRFLIGGDEIKLTNLDVNLILGVSGGDKAIPIKVTGCRLPKWVNRCFGRELANEKGRFFMYKNLIYDKLKEALSMNNENSLLDVARLTHCYLLAVLLAPNQNTSMAVQLTQYLENFDDICGYDWCSFIVNMLKSQIMSSRSLKAGGCAMLLPFWLCEHTNLIKPVNEVAFPRFLKWDLKELKKCLARINIAERSKSFVQKLELKATSIEKDAFQSLHKYWEAKQENITYNDESAENIDDGSFKGKLVIYDKGESPDNIEDTIPIAMRDEIDSGMVDTPNRSRGVHVDKPPTSKNQGSNREVDSQLVTSLDLQKNSRTFEGPINNPRTSRTFEGPINNPCTCEFDDIPSFSQKISDFVTQATNVGAEIDKIIEDSLLNEFVGQGKSYGWSMEGEKDVQAKLEECRGFVLERDREIEILKVQMHVFSEEKEKVLQLFNAKMEKILEKEKEIENLKVQMHVISEEKEKVLQLFKIKMEKILEKEKEIKFWKEEAFQLRDFQKKGIHEKIKQHVDSKWVKQMEEEKESHKKEMWKMESEIGMLRVEKEELRVQLKEAETLAHVDSIEKLHIARLELMKILVKINASLTQTIDAYAETDNFNDHEK